MKGFYQVTETIKNQLLADVNVNTVTTGDITKIDLSKQTMFPLSHIIVNNVNNEDNVLRFSISVLSMDIVDVSKEAVVDIFVGNDNEQDILNTQLAVITRLLEVLRKGSSANTFMLDGNATLENFTDRFEHGVAGWTRILSRILRSVKRWRSWSP